jgi:nucleoside-diphosphate-sugar epimerase
MIDRRSLLVAAASTIVAGSSEGAPRGVVITGDLGRVAAYIKPLFSGFVGIDKKRGDYQDLAYFDEAGWVRAFDGADVVVHLAASLGNELPELLHDTYEASVNVLRACSLHRVPLVIFASSLWASPALGHKTIKSVDPVNYYGASKRNAEAMMAAHAATTGAATVAIRLGTVPPIGTPVAQTDSAWQPWVRIDRDGY